MTQLLLNIKDDAKTKVLLQFLKSLNYISVEPINNKKITLTEDQKRFVDEGLNALKAGGSLSHKQVIAESKKRYPDLFK